MARPKGSKNTGPLTELQKLAKKIGPDGDEVVAELEAADVEALNKRIAQANQSISDTKAELELNEDYQQAKSDVKLLSSGLSEVKKRQNSIIAVAVSFRKAKGAA